MKTPYLQALEDTLAGYDERCRSERSPTWNQEHADTRIAHVNYLRGQADERSKAEAVAEALKSAHDLIGELASLVDSEDDEAMDWHASLEPK